MYLLKDLNGEYSFSLSDSADESLVVVDTIDNDIYSLICNHPDSYKIENDKVVLLKSKNEILADDIRIRRESECFPYINRGALWYNKLTDEESRELSKWYADWLDAPATLVVPEKLSWLDSKL